MSRIDHNQPFVTEYMSRIDRDRLLSLPKPRFTGTRFFRRYYRLFLTILLVITDVVSNLVAPIVCYLTWNAIKGDMDAAIYTRLLPLILFFPLAYVLTGLYPAIGMSPVDEFRRLTISTIMVYMIIVSLSFFFRNAEQYSRVTFLLSLLGTILMLPVGRSILRAVLVKNGIFGEPVAIIGSGEHAQKIHDYFLIKPELGFHPVIMLDGSDSNLPPSQDQHVANLATVFRKGLPEQAAGVQTAFLVPEEISPELLKHLFEVNKSIFHKLILTPNDWIWGTIAITPLDVEGILCLSVQHNLYNRVYKVLKTIIDLSLIVLSSPIWLSILGISAILIKLDTHGSVLYSQVRLGRAGKKIRIWKLRTMIQDAELQLREYLEKNPEYSKDWETNYKILNDQRVTRVGKILRRFSLDEIPQFWNVIKGEMSLVGPRPIVDAERVRFGSRLETILKVKPGISGYWQISGRNDILYNERVLMDEYYVKNCSLWFDIYIIFKTIIAMIGGRGAY